MASRTCIAGIAVALLLFTSRAEAQRKEPIDPASFAQLHWRNIGPFRGGRAVAVAGVAGDARIAYSGAVGGGVWKTANAGRTWLPTTDAQPVSSIGAIAVAPSDPKMVYVGSGEADMRSDIIGGNGMYRSSDAGATWHRIGLEDSQQIGRILVDPHDPERVLVAALGHAYAPNATRGVYRSADGGASWTRTLFRDANTGAIDLASDARMRVVYASLWQTRRPPWNAYPPSNGPGSGVYRSADGGLTWSAVLGNGFPTQLLGKAGLAVAPSDARRVYAIVDAKAGGLYRSDDAGLSWRLVAADARLWQRGWYFCHVAVDPKNRDTVYISNTSLYRSSDGGAHFDAIKGSPDGDDFHQLWIDPNDSSHLILGSDQGASVSLDRAQTWSSWFNQPTGQFYHVAVDRTVPYHLFGAQQDSGAAMILSRSDHRGIEGRDWRPLAAGGESGELVPDPLDANIVYGGSVQREDLRSNQTKSVSPTTGLPGLWRSEWTLPLAFGTDRALYAANQFVYRTRDGGNRWSTISGDLTRAHAGTPVTLDAATAADAATSEPRGVVYALGPSPLDPNVLWAGTDDGLVRLTVDGGRSWRDVTPPGISAWSRIAAIEASHFDRRTAYVAIDRHRLDDDRPYVFVTRDGGRSWQSLGAGLPEGSFVHVVREDGVARNLLYAGTETGVFVSFDGGAAWLSLRLNMPVVSVRDIAVHDGDLAIATHGRAFWILDDVEPLRELSAGIGGGAVHLYAPGAAIRMRAGDDEAETTPPEVPLGENPPSGAAIDYALPQRSAGPVALDVLDARGVLLRHWSSDDTLAATKPQTVDYPAYWLAPPLRLAASAGVHRFFWDFHASRADGPLCAPGRYLVRLTYDGHAYAQPLVVRRDPRVSASDADLVAQAHLATAVDALYAQTENAIAAAQIARARPNVDLAQIDALAGTPPGEGLRAPQLSSLRYQAGLLADLFASIESADGAPTERERTAWRTLDPAARHALAAWRAFAEKT